MNKGSHFLRFTKTAVVTLVAALPIFTLGSLPAQADQPKRVMSLNLCTDQMAMALAGPDQLISVSFLAQDRTISPMWREAAQYPVNHGRAEEVFLEKPDLVLTGTFSLHNTTQLLRRVGIPVEEFSFAMTLETVPDEIRRMGALLDQTEKAETIAASFENDLATVKKAQCEPRPSILAFEQNGISPGKNTLADSVFTTAGFRNLAAEAGLVGAAPFPLETVIRNAPDVIVVQSRGEEAPTLGAYVPSHPAMKSLTETQIDTFLPPGSWSCNGPLIIEAVKTLAKLRQDIAPCGNTAP